MSTITSSTQFPDCVYIFTVSTPLPQVHEYYGYSSDVPYLAVSLIDRYLAKVEDHITLDNLQLVVGLVCLQLSCKYEDLFVLDLDEMSQLVEGGFSAEEIRQMELMFDILSDNEP